MKKRLLFVVCSIAGGLFLGPSMAYAKNGNCFFQATGTNIAFGALDPSTVADVTRAMTPGTSGQGRDCNAGSMSLSDDGGSHQAREVRRLSNRTDFIPCTL